jgi:hypothetical protein
MYKRKTINLKSPSLQIESEDDSGIVGFEVEGTLVNHEVLKILKW